MYCITDPLKTMDVNKTNTLQKLHRNQCVNALLCVAALSVSLVSAPLQRQPRSECVCVVVPHYLLFTRACTNMFQYVSCCLGLCIAHSQAWFGWIIITSLWRVYSYKFGFVNWIFHKIFCNTFLFVIMGQSSSRRKWIYIFLTTKVFAEG